MGKADATDRNFLAERAKILFDRTRLEKRLFTLEHITLASILAQTDQDFDFYILTSASLPEEWLHRLSELCARVPQARLLVSTETDTNEALAPILMEIRQSQSATPLQFRLDDDDAVGVRFIEKLRCHWKMLEQLPKVAIGFPRGLSVITYNGASPSFWQTHRGFTGAGAAARFQDSRRSIFSINHFTLSRRLPAFSDISIMGHFVLLWDSGDTAPNLSTRIPWGYEATPEVQFRRDLDEHFPFLRAIDWSRFQLPG